MSFRQARTSRVDVFRRALMKRVLRADPAHQAQILAEAAFHLEDVHRLGLNRLEHRHADLDQIADDRQDMPAGVNVRLLAGRRESCRPAGRAAA